MLLPELAQQVARPLDRTRHQLRKERHEERKDAQVLLRLDPAVVHVDRVAHRLEGIEGDTHGQQQLEGGRRVAHPHQIGQIRGSAVEEVVVLEGEENTQVGEQAQPQPGLAPLPLLLRVAVHHDATGVVDQGGDDQDDGVVHPPEHIEGVAGNKQQEPTEAVRQQEVEPNHGRKEQQELEGIE